MDIQQLIVGFIFMLCGGLTVVRPDILLKFQIWTQKTIMGAQYIPGRRTRKTMQILGAFFIVLGLIVLTGSRR